MLRPVNLLIALFVLLPGIGCKDKYISPYTAPPTGYLVVEGYISGNSPTQFTLSRSVKLPGDSTPPPESGAMVQVEGSDNSIRPLPETSMGVYSDSFALSTQAQYRLRIHTTNGEDYLSDFVPFKTTPPIDSVSWTNGPNGVVIYINTHDPANNTHYYQWNWDQVYEYQSAAYSSFIYSRAADNLFLRADSDQIFHCWASASSSSILLSSSTKLAQDVISLYPIKSVPPNDIQLSVLYSILVRQYALTEDGYNFLSMMQKNTESLGTVFDAQPSQITGNIHCLTHAMEQVIGFVSAGTVEQQRIYIARYQVPSQYEFTCDLPDTLLPADTDLRKNFSFEYTAIYPDEKGTAILGYYSNYTTCVDCRDFNGGTNKKPFWWPIN
jgi:hypothetical protein